MQKQILGPDFFNRPAPIVARQLLGKYLVRQWEGKTEAYMISETEAYHGFKDKASHAHRGMTERNAPMFGKPSTIYVYFTYGMHWMLNLICGKEGMPSGVLIRAAGPYGGPALLTKGLHIDKSLKGEMLSKKAGLWIEDRGTKLPSKDVYKTPRIGIRYAAEWIDKPWRFVYKPAKTKQ